jgi:hypothetical protein
MIKSSKKVTKQWGSSFSYYFCMQCSGSGSKSLTSGSGSGRPKNKWIRIRNTACNNHIVLLNLPLRRLEEIEGGKSSSLMKKAKNHFLFSSHDGPMPILPGFQALERMRREEMPDLFPGTTGLISQGHKTSN